MEDDNKVCYICFKAYAQCRTDKKFIGCSMCNKHSYHLSCLGLTGITESCLEHLAFFCPANRGCNVAPPMIKTNSDWICGLCQNKNVVIKCSKCDIDHCQSCSNLTDGMLKICNMMPKDNFLWCCFNCVDEGDESQVDDARPSERSSPNPTADVNSELSSPNAIGSANDIEQSVNVGIHAENNVGRDQNAGESNTGTLAVNTNIRLCRFYLRNTCKYGISGKGCKFSHPKICVKFMEQGFYGCNSRKLCGKFHPKVCENSFRRMKCENVECNEIHIKGTRLQRSVVTDDLQASDASVNRNVVELPRFDANSRFNHNNSNPRNYNHNIVSQQNHSVKNTNTIDSNFLVEMIADLDSKFQQILDLNSPRDYPPLMLPQHMRPSHEHHYRQQRLRRL